MKINIARKIMEVLENDDREDLAESFRLFYQEHCDEDYSPPKKPRPEPPEEYYDNSHSDCESEDLKVGVSPDGFFFLK